MTKPLTPRQAECVRRLGEFPQQAFLDADAAALRGRWRDHFIPRIGPLFDGRLVVEIGCADGSLLTRVAAKHPRTGFVGLDWKYGDILRAAERVDAAGLTNVALVRGRAQAIRSLFADGEADEIWVFHPDPCATPTERPNRLIAEPFLLNAAAVLRGAGSTLSLKTDHAGYYQSTLALLGQPAPDWSTLVPRVRLRDLEDPSKLPAPSDVVARAMEVVFTATDFTGDRDARARVETRAFAGEQTTYEAKFAAKRRPIFFIELRRRGPL